MILFCCVLDTDAFNIKTVKLKTFKKVKVWDCALFTVQSLKRGKKHGQWRLFSFDTWVKVCLFVCMCACVCYEISFNIRLQRLSETHAVAGQFIERISLCPFFDLILAWPKHPPICRFAFTASHGIDTRRSHETVQRKQWTGSLPPMSLPVTCIRTSASSTNSSHNHQFESVLLPCIIRVLPCLPTIKP